MVNKEKVIKGLKCCANGCLGDYCPYFKLSNCGQVLTKEALELLKEQDNCENCAMAIADMRKGDEAGMKNRWVSYGGPFCNAWKCPVCGEVQDLKFGAPLENGWLYCPHCGERLEEEESDD